MLTIVTIAVPIVLVAIIAAIWWVMRDPTPPPRPPGCHRRRRDPHDPIRGDDEEPPEQHDLSLSSWDGKGRRGSLAIVERRNHDSFLPLMLSV